MSIKVLELSKPSEPDEDGWTKETWMAFYAANKAFMEGTHPTIKKKKKSL